jgi:hypothetical protein
MPSYAIIRNGCPEQHLIQVVLTHGGHRAASCRSQATFPHARAPRRPVAGTAELVARAVGDLLRQDVARWMGPWT